MLAGATEKWVEGIEVLDEVGMALEERIRVVNDVADVGDLALAEAREEGLPKRVRRAKNST